ncbi:hypothetical protein DRW03_27235 [Corallococcus sp. H22C18031201]|uniref:hypothetical protein n=1 Tax=Citreicoccus inhibens TaxID=2849499 RepID=UPI000E749060|nr:hypothetical protein [Citreicoccus inhibens]MBU8894839.1 hypothetical protein [Citreicoccus inhibens]RJS17684.1 hypothetical protein DRW03_27235 [Corallococcus sp. H22C18031201]
MSTNAPTALSDRSKWLLLAGLVALPLYVLPVGFRGLRAMRPLLLRDALGGAIALGALSLSQMALCRALSAKKPRALPRFQPFCSEEFAASAASGH